MKKLILLLAILSVAGGLFLLSWLKNDDRRLSNLVENKIVDLEAANRDIKRISDVSRLIPDYLELYFNQNGKYPETDWAGLAEELGPDKAKVLVSKKLPEAVGQYSYFYCSGANSFTYTLGVRLEADDKVLDDSITGEHCGVNCGRNSNSYIYCVTP